MTAAPVGAVVKLYVDLREVVEPHHVIVHHIRWYKRRKRA